MMLKFGRLVDLDKLEDIHVNKVAEELRMKIEAVERKTAKFLTESDVSRPIHPLHLCPCVIEWSVIQTHIKVLSMY